MKSKFIFSLIENVSHWVPRGLMSLSTLSRPLVAGGKSPPGSPVCGLRSEGLREVASPPDLSFLKHTMKVLQVSTSLKGLGTGENRQWVLPHYIKVRHDHLHLVIILFCMFSIALSSVPFFS